MPLIYVTGVSTAGKSSVLGELRRRGYAAFGVDEDGYGVFVHRESQRVVEPPLEDVDPHDWYREHAWVSTSRRSRSLPSA
jgi:predicted ATPase